MINLAADVVQNFSDGDFPHWSGWRLVDDDADSNSQCNSVILRGGGFTDFRQMICHFPLEWCNTGIEARYGWLKEGVIQERQENEANSDLSLGTDYYRPNNVEYNTTGDSMENLLSQLYQKCQICLMNSQMLMKMPSEFYYWEKKTGRRW